MAKTHNKKRNVAIIFEQLLKKAAQAIVEKKPLGPSVAIGIIDNHFIPGTELYKEFRLFNALIKTTVDSEAIAVRILEESKKAAKSHNPRKLRSEKSALIKEINHTFKDRSFYNQDIENYRDYATVQTLLNDWRSNCPDIKRIALYESHTVKMLLHEKSTENINDLKDDEINQLTVNIMKEKFNKKYGSILDDEQRTLIREYVFSLSSNSASGFSEKLKHLKRQTLSEIRSFKVRCNNNVLLQKVDEVEKKIKSTMIENIDDDTLSRVLLLSKLKQEILENEK